MTDSANTRATDAEWLMIEHAVARLRASVMAVAFGTTAGTGLFIATIWLVIRGGEVVGPTLGLLGQYFPGYSVSWAGAFIGFVYAFLAGGAIGWTVTYVYNNVVNRRESSE